MKTNLSDLYIFRHVILLILHQRTTAPNISITHSHTVIVKPTYESLSNCSFSFKLKLHGFLSELSQSGLFRSNINLGVQDILHLSMNGRE